MPIYKPSELRQFLVELGANPKKALSQNFLIDGNIIRKIVKTVEIQPNDVILEIGPGPGSLTEALLETGATVLAVEKDNVMAQALERLKSPTNHLEVFSADIMEFPVEDTLKKYLSKGSKAKVIANLPYHLTTPILANLVTKFHCFSHLVVMVQDEVARRFTSAPNRREYSSFTVFLNFYSHPRYAFQVSKHCFYPEPSVESAVVVLDLKEPPQVSNIEEFFKMTRTAFEHRRKMLRGSLRELYDPAKVSEALSEINGNPQSRPELLSLEQFLQLFEFLKHKSS